MSDVLNIDILANVDLDNLKEVRSVVSQIVSEAEQLSNTMDQVEGSTGLFNRQLDGCRSTAELLNKRIDSFEESTTGNHALFEDEAKQRLDSIKDMAADLQAMTSLVFNDGKFSARAAHGLLDRLPKEISKRFTEVAPQIMSIINGKMNGINLQANKKIFEGIEFNKARSLLDSVFEVENGDKYAKAYKSRLTKLLIQNANPIYSTGEYHQARYGKDWQKVFNSSKYEFQHKNDLLPELYKNIFRDNKFSFKANNENDTFRDSQNILLNLLKTNKFAREAAIMSGLATRKGDYVSFSDVQSKKSVGNFATTLYDMFSRRIKGLSSGELGVINDINSPENERRIISRMSNGSGSQILSAMHVVSNLLTGAGTFNSLDKTALPVSFKEKERLKEMYAIPEYGFAGKRNKMVAVSESQLTDLLGFTGKDYSTRNEIAELNLANYDYNDPDQRKELLNVIKNGVHNGDYQFHSFHGTGENLKARLIRKEAVDAINKKYADFAKKYGFAGEEILYSFMPKDNLTADEFGKSQDELGKIWTDGVKTSKDLSDKRFSVVDFSALKNGKWTEFVDGMNIMMNSVIDSPGQTRFALGVKGSNTVISGYKNFGEWAEKAGFISAGKHIYLPGLRAKENPNFNYEDALHGNIDDATAQAMIAAGQLTDVTNINGGLVSASTIKNKTAYRNMKSSEDIDKAMTALTRLTGIRTPANYEEESSSVASLGPQASAFLSLSKTTKESQDKYVKEVLGSLGTIEGIRKYVFANETDELARRINDPNGEPGAINNPAVQKRVALFRESLMNKVLTGDIFNTNDKVITMAKGRTLKDPLSAMLGLSNGKLTDAQYQQYNEIMKNANGKDYTKEELEDLINLKDAAVSFELRDRANELGIKNKNMAIMRSPSAYGALVVRRNVANELEPLYDALGLSKVGTYLNDEDLKTLQGADLDGDTVKAFIGTIVGDVSRTIEKVKKAKGDDFKEAELITEDVGDIEGGWSLTNPLALLEIAKRSKDATYGMARASNIGTRLQQFNLNDPSYGMLAAMAANANPLYDFYTTYQKKMKNLIDMSNRTISGTEFGYEFAKLPVRLGNIFDINKYVEDDQVVMRNGQGDIVNGIEDNKGRLINTDALKELNIDAFNMPSMYNDAAILAMMRSKRAYNRGYGNSDYTDELTHILTNMTDYKGFDGTSVGNLMRNMRKIKAEFLSGARFGISKEEEDVLAKQLYQAEKQIEDMIHDPNASKINPETLKEFTGNKEEKMRKYYMRKAGIYQAQMLLGRYQLDLDNGKKIVVGSGYTNGERANSMSKEERAFLEQKGLSLDNATVNPMSKEEMDAYIAREENMKKMAIKEKEDKKHLSGVRFIDPSLIADDGTIMARERDGKVVPLKDHKYHFSELHSAMSSPSAWFDTYMGNKKVFNESIALGNAVHKTMESILKPGVGSTDTVEKFFDLKNAESTFAKFLKTEYEDYGYDKQNSRGNMIKRAGEFIGNLDKILNNETVVGTEATVAGKMDTDKYGQLDFTGNYDLLTRDKNGNLILSDFKPRKNYGTERPEHTVTGSSVGDQLYLYAYAYNEREKAQKGQKADLIKQLRVLGYGDDVSSDALKNSAKSTFEYDENIAKEVYDRYSREAELVRTVRQKATSKEDALKLFNNLPIVENELEHLEKIEKAQEAENTAKRASLAEYGEITANIKKGSIRDIANQFQLKDKVEAYEKELFGIEGNILKRNNYQNEAKRPNFWNGINYALTNGFEDQIGELKAHGLSDAEENLMRARRNKIYEEFSAKRDEASSGDFYAFEDLVTKQMNEEGLSGQLKSYIGLTEELEQKFREAANAKDSLTNEKNDIEDKIKNGKGTDEDRKRLDVVNALLKRADQAEETAQETKEKRQDQLKEKLNKNLDHQISSLEYSFTGKDNPITKIDYQIDDLIEKKQNQLKEIKAAFENGGISEDQYKNKKAIIENLDPEATRQRLYNERLDASTKNIDRLLEQGENIGANRNYRYRRDVFSRAQFAAMSELKSRQGYQHQLEDQRDKAIELRDGFEKVGNMEGFDSASANVEKLTKAMAENEQQMKSLKSVSGLLNKGMEELGYSITMVVSRFGRQMFQRALQEAKKFVVEFDTAMSQIQTITMKSDQEMESVRTQTINKAIELRTSVSNVSDVEASLYRQGLSDSEVEKRTEDIIKFATITGVKATDATKSLTAAVQSGLVSSVEEAMDVMAALGDNAATTAQEISKAMQKSVGAAKQANMSFAELTALLTIGTEKTQLGGTQVGTAVNTMLQRMQRVTTNKYVTDEDGNTTSINDVEAALKLAGVSLRDENGEFIKDFDILRALSSNWNDLSSLQRSNVTYAMAGTRANIFQNIMEGMSEDGGATLEKYLGLAEGSEGIVDKKYDIYIDNIATSLTTLKSAFDGFVESISNNSIISKLIDGISDMFVNLTNLSKASSGISSGLAIIASGIMGIVASLILAKTAMAPISSLIGLVVGGVGLGLISSTGKDLSTPQQKRVDTYKQAVSNKDIVDENISSMQELIKKYEESGDAISEIDAKAFKQDVYDLRDVFPDLAYGIDLSTASLEKWKKVMDEIEIKTPDVNRAVVLSEISTLKYGNQFAGEAETFHKQISDYTTNTIEYDDKNALINYFSEYGSIGKQPKMEETPTGWIIQSYDSVVKDIIKNKDNPSYDIFGNNPDNYLRLKKLLYMAKEKDEEGYIRRFGDNNPEGVLNLIGQGKYSPTTYNEFIRETLKDDYDSVMNGTYSQDIDYTEDIRQATQNAVIDLFKGYISRISSISDNPEIADDFLQAAISNFGTDYYITPSAFYDFIGTHFQQNYSDVPKKEEVQPKKLYSFNVGDDVVYTTDLSDEGIEKAYADEKIYQTSIAKYKYDDSEIDLAGYLNYGNYKSDSLSEDESDYFDYNLNYVPIDDDAEGKLKQDLKTFYTTRRDNAKKHLEEIEAKYENATVESITGDSYKDIIFTDENGKNYKRNSDGSLRQLTSVAETIDTVGLSSKEKGFVNEYRNLMRYLVSGDDMLDSFIDEKDNEQFANLMPMLKDDKDLEKMLESYKQGTGEYSEGDILRHIYEKAYGASYVNSYKNIGQYTNLRDMRNLSDRAKYANELGYQLDSETASQIASALGVDVSTFYNNQDEYINDYNRIYGENESIALDAARSDIVNRLSGYDLAGANSMEDVLSKLQSEMDTEAFEEFKSLVDNYSKVGIEIEYEDGEIKAAINDMDDFGGVSKNAIDMMDKLKGSVSDVNGAMKNFNNVATKAADNQFFRNKFKNGDRSQDTLKAISNMTGFGEDALQTMKIEDIMPMLDISEAADLYEINDWANGFNADLAEAVRNAMNNGSEVITVDPGSTVSLDFSQVLAELANQGIATVNAAVAILQSIYAQGQLVVSSDSNGNVEASFNVTNLGKGRSSSGSKGGGGGKGKSKSATLIEELKRQKELLDHRVKMVRFQETKYQNLDELGNYGLMIEEENRVQEDLIRLITDSIAKLEEQSTKVKKGSDDWYDLRKAIMEYEEELEEANNTIDENIKKLKENEQAILKLHTDLEDTVKEEIESRIQDERDMLDGTTGMQDIILEAIKNRYQKEWDLVKEDIDRKRKALEEEKSMIDERLKRRKEAEDEAEKYEKLAEYRKQYALISADSTRTKDAAELRKKIADLEKEIGWGIAEDEAEIQKKQIEDQLNAYEEFTENGDEDLEAFLQDANNFANEVNDILGSSHETLMQWLSDNVEEYGYSLDEQKQKTLNEWEDMYKQMLGIVDTYWEEIARILSDKDVFLNYLKASKTYMNASEDEQKQLLYQWGDMFDKWILAQKRNAEYSHTDEGLEDATKVTYGGGSSSGSSSSGKVSYDNGSVSSSGIAKMQQYLGVTADGKFGPATLAAAKKKLGSGVTDAASAYAAYVRKTKEDNMVKKAGTASPAYIAYADGGLVDFTGPAWVDGTKSKPEAFLDAEDTALIRSMLDAVSLVDVKPFISNIDSGSFSNSSSNIGEVTIVINQAELKEDADFEEVAKKVGEQFVKELNKQGLNSVRFSF